MQPNEPGEPAARTPSNEMAMNYRSVMIICLALVGLALPSARLCAQTAVIVATPAPCAPEPAIPGPPVAKTMPATAEELACRVLNVVAQTMPCWQSVDVPQVCDNTCVAERLPQDAALIAGYCFVWGLTVRLIPPETQQEIIVRVFRMGDELDAFGMFAQHRNDRTVTAPLKTQSFWSGDEFHLWRGLFYIRVTPTASGKVMHASALAAGEAVAAQIPAPEQLPLMMRLMPHGRSMPYSLRYYRHNVLGQTALGDGLVDTYLEDTTKLTLAVLRAPDEPTSVQLYAAVLAIASGGGSNMVTPVADMGKAAATVESRQFGLCYAMREGQYVALALGVHDRNTAEGLLRIAATNMRVSKY